MLLLLLAQQYTFTECCGLSGMQQAAASGSFHCCSLHAAAMLS
jgi:hypothetical protein